MGLSSEHAIGNELEIDWSQEQLLKDVNMEVPPQLQASQARNNQQQQQQQQQRQQPFPPLKCPRCDSINTKFCYYNNYSRSQPRYLCKACKRHWTQGGTLRSVPVGGTRRNKRNKSSSSASITSTPNSSNKNPPVLNISQPFPSLSENMLRIQSQVFPPHYFSSMIIPDAPAISPYVYSGQQQQFLGPNINYAGPSSGVVANDGDASGGGGDIQLLGPSSDCWPSWENDIVNINLPYVPEDDL